jgi:hypothetical protein
MEKEPKYNEIDEKKLAFLIDLLCNNLQFCLACKEMGKKGRSERRKYEKAIQENLRSIMAIDIKLADQIHYHLPTPEELTQVTYDLFIYRLKNIVRLFVRR